MKTALLSIAILFSCSAFAAHNGAGDSIATVKPEAGIAAKDSIAKKESIAEKESAIEKEGATVINKYGKKVKPVVFKATQKLLGKETTAIAEKGYDATMGFITGKLKNYLDSSGIKGTDPTYVGLPKRKWRVSLIGDMDNMLVNVDSRVDVNTVTAQGLNVHNMWDFDLKIRPHVSASTGIWVGYMGYGVGLSYLKTGQSNTNLAMNFTSPNYSINLRWIHYNRDHGLHDWYSKGMTFQDLMRSDDYGFEVSSIVFDAYWIFNKKKFSLAAAYDMSTIQLRSAGSFIAGVVYNYQKCDYAVPDNVRILTEANGIGKVKMYQGSISGGYTYNWVPTPGLVVNITGMPVLTLYSHSELYKYQWSMVPKTTGSEEIIGVNMDYKDSHSENGKVALNFNARVAAAYRYKNFVFSFMAQAYYLRSYLDATSFKVFQWNMKASAGITL